MGTRSLTYVYDNQDRPILNMYRQFDGYPSGHGADLANFLEGMQIVNGLPMQPEDKIANGMGCLAAQLVAHFKDGPGGIYLYSVESNNCFQDYEYSIYPEYITVHSYDKMIFDGSWEEFRNFCNEKEVA